LRPEPRQNKRLEPDGEPGSPDRLKRNEPLPITKRRTLPAVSLRPGGRTAEREAAARRHGRTCPDRPRLRPSRSVVFRRRMLPRGRAWRRGPRTRLRPPAPGRVRLSWGAAERREARGV